MGGRTVFRGQHPSGEPIASRRAKVLALADLVALDDIGGLHLIAALGVDLLIFNPVAGVLVDLVVFWLIGRSLFLRTPGRAIAAIGAPRAPPKSSPRAAPQEAIFVIERELLSAGVRCRGLRFFPYPDADGRLVVVVAELSDGSDLQLLTRLDWPIVVHGDDYDEAAIARQFAMPSQSVH